MTMLGKCISVTNDREEKRVEGAVHTSHIICSTAQEYIINKYTI